MNDTTLTVVGNVVDSPRRVRLENGSVTNFRMASTARRYDTRSQEFIDSGTLWVDIECWGDLGANVSSSISKGDPVIVHGALTTHSWESENGKRSAPRIKAFAVGPNLQRGSAEFRRNRPRTADATADRSVDGSQPEPQDDAFAERTDEFIPGRDYVGEEEALDNANADDFSLEPAHA
ncbi:MAG: single-stranded DNA-binding protein [Blastococcus sp.]